MKMRTRQRSSPPSRDMRIPKSVEEIERLVRESIAEPDHDVAFGVGDVEH